MRVPSVFLRRGILCRYMLVWVIGAGLAGSSPLLAQNRVGRPGLFDPAQANPILQLQTRTLEEAASTGIMALEGALDPATYIVGPGDQFSVAVGGVAPVTQVVPITADGHLVLLDAGVVQAAGRTLDAVQQEAVAALQRIYEHVAVEVSLVQPRMFYVHVSGAVPEPGRYLMLPVARVDDVLQQAYASRIVERPDPQAQGTPRIVTSATSERPALNPNFRPSLRNVQLTHRDGTRRVLDLIRYYTTGDTAQNPYLLDGDVVTVPSYHVDRDVVHVTGAVTYPGTYDFRTGDTALDLLVISTGPGSLDAVRDVRLTRRGPDGRATSQVLDAQALRSGQAVPLEPGDQLHVVPPTSAEASIQGMVAYPGTYPIADNETTLRELVAMAGGLKANASVRGAFIERRESLNFKEDGQASDLDFFSRAFAQRAKQANFVIGDVAAALEPGSPDIVLRTGDRVVFPRDEDAVYVMGNVPRPGYVPFVEGRPARYYLDQTGGPAPLSTTIYVFEEGTGKMRTGDDAVVRSGDTIFVDRQGIVDDPELAALFYSERATRRQSRIMTTQAIIAGVSAITGIITAYVAVRNL